MPITAIMPATIAPTAVAPVMLAVPTNCPKPFAPVSGCWRRRAGAFAPQLYGKPSPRLLGPRPSTVELVSRFGLPLEGLTNCYRRGPACLSEFNAPG